MPGKIHMVAIIALGGGMAALGAAAGRTILGHADASARAVIKDVNGKTVGSLKIEEDDGRQEITISASGLHPGYHGFHIHAKGVCDPKSKDPETGTPFFSAGPHFSLHKASHPDHSGDLPDLLAGTDGKGSATFKTDRFHIGQLLDKDGSSVVIHELPDNQSNIPHRYSHSGGGNGPDAETLKAGDSGTRIACGVISKS